MTRQSDSFPMLVAQTRDERARVRRLVATGQWRRAEEDKDRLGSYMARVSQFVAPQSRAEALQGETIDFQPVSFLPVGTRVQRAVGYVETSVAGKASSGSGFLISPDLFITNQHVIETAEAAIGGQVTFDRQAGEDGRPMATTTFLLDPKRCALFSPEEELDYAVVAIGKRLSGNVNVADLGYCPLSNRPDKHRKGMNVNIIQHPNGQPKLIAVRNNLLTHRTPRTLLYETDTNQGSSGSPVFNDLWEVIALHHYGEPYLETVDEIGETIPVTVNEGVRISAIYHDLEKRLPSLSGEARALVEAALAFDRVDVAAVGDRTLGPPRPSVRAEASRQEPAPSPAMPLLHSAQSSAVPSGAGAIEMTRTHEAELKVTIPIEVTIRVGGAGGENTTSTSDGPAPTLLSGGGKLLGSRAEKLRIDRNYDKREGYVPRFIRDFDIPLPKPNEALSKQIAPLHSDQPDADSGVLRYEHFSLILNKAKRLAMFTATNIDGKTYLAVNRETGRVVAGAEGESWFDDPRVSKSYFIDQSFYSEWSDYFDRGHLTRRTDPTWGAPEEAERANADTYHFPNCSPQHFRFNQTTKFWQGAERYVLEKGVLATEKKPRISVFQGPIFTDAVDRWADDVQIPSSFFKVIVWKSGETLKAVGLVVDQLALLDETRRGLSRPSNEAPVMVNQWRVSISAIEERTGLDFGSLVRKADTFGSADQPVVGEAQISIRDFHDLLR